MNKVLVLENLLVALDNNPEWWPVVPIEPVSDLNTVMFAEWGRTGGTFHKSIGTEGEEFHKK